MTDTLSGGPNRGRRAPMRAQPQASPPRMSAAAGEADAPRFLSREACEAILQQAQAVGLGVAHLDSWWRHDLRWARNRLVSAEDWRTNRLQAATGWGATLEMNQLDAASLRGLATRSRELAFLNTDVHEPEVEWVIQPAAAYPKPPIWSEATYQLPPGEQVAQVTKALTGAEQAGVLSAGYLAVEACGATLYAPGGVVLYAPRTLAQCSITVRDPKRRGSGWAGASSFDWAHIDVAQLAATALDKCLTSRDPVKLEPGRYTTILEPQAVYEFLCRLFTPQQPFMKLEQNEPPDANRPRLPFMDWPPVAQTYERGDFQAPVHYLKTRLGEPVIDARLSIRSDPLDPALGTLPFTNIENYGALGTPLGPVTWIEHGVLKNLWMPSDYALRTRHAAGQPWPFTPFHPDSQAMVWGGCYRLESSAPPVPLEEMIATTQRGLLVTRLWELRSLDATSAQCAGMTRDGVWLVEQGKLTHPVQNFRFTESVLAVLNRVEQIGAPGPIFNPEGPALIPALKVRDFSFTALVDGV